MKVKINALNAMEIGGNIILNISIPSKFKSAVESFSKKEALAFGKRLRLGIDGRNSGGVANH